jgi:hypothetical protein
VDSAKEALSFFGEVTGSLQTPQPQYGFIYSDKVLTSKAAAGPVLEIIYYDEQEKPVARTETGTVEDFLIMHEVLEFLYESRVYLANDGVSPEGLPTLPDIVEWLQEFAEQRGDEAEAALREFAVAHGVAGLIEDEWDPTIIRFIGRTLLMKEILNNDDAYYALLFLAMMLGVKSAFDSIRCEDTIRERLDKADGIIQYLCQSIEENLQRELSFSCGLIRTGT